jgi:hypothetical protein
MTLDLTDEESLDFLSDAVSPIGTATASEDVVTDQDSEPGHNPTFGTKDVSAATRYSEGDKVETTGGTRGVVVEIYTEPFDGPDGDEVDASDSSPAYVIATEEGAEAVKASDLKASDWSTDRENADDELAKEVAASDIAARLEAADQDFVETGSLEASVTDWDYPDSWTESDIPARLILLDAWSSMGGQFDCGGGCCKGTMMSNGMSDRASDQFCASMKDRVLLWEGWRQGG